MHGERRAGDGEGVGGAAVAFGPLVLQGLGGKRQQILRDRPGRQLLTQDEAVMEALHALADGQALTEETATLNAQKDKLQEQSRELSKELAGLKRRLKEKDGEAPATGSESNKGGGKGAPPPAPTK